MITFDEKKLLQFIVPVEKLSDREAEVFELLALGQTIKNIAAKLQISPKTVGTHVDKIKIKLRANSLHSIEHMATSHFMVQNIIDSDK